MHDLILNCFNHLKKKLYPLTESFPNLSLKLKKHTKYMVRY